MDRGVEEGSGELRVGLRVRVLKGFLSGRLGIIQAIDEKGDVRVTFGSLVSRLSQDEVSAAGSGYRDRRDRSPRKRPRG